MSLKIRFTAVLLILAGFAQLIYLHASNGKTSAAGALAYAAQRPVAQPVKLGLTLDQPVAVDLSTDRAALADMSAREREDQQRDWLLFTAVASLGLPADAYAQIMFDLPSTRQGYMRPVAAFEYGKTRSRLVQAGVVLALVPAGVSAQQRRDDLAHIADLQRKNQGGAFERLMVVDYTLDSATGKAALTLRNDVPFQQVFSAAYGYVEREVKNRESLVSFMAEVDDLSLMRKIGGALVLGGRKSKATPRQNIGVEEIATVWQSEQKIQQDRQRFERYVEKEEDRIKAKWGQVTYSNAMERESLKQKIESEIESGRARVEEYKQTHQLYDASGFSLDPAHDFPKLALEFERFSTEIIPQLVDTISPEVLGKVTAALKQRDMLPYEELKRGNNNPLLGAMLSLIENKNAFQAARYDGELQGTEVGMVLFYTDLLAKMWVIDFMQTSPAHGALPVFLDHPGAARMMSSVYVAERSKLSSARLWFGHTDQGYQLSSAGDAVLLASNATRIFSAGTNPLSPGKEVQTSAFLAAPIDWWNDHYEEVAAIEPQYQRLNQIMKWSVLLAWLNKSGDGDKLKFLEEVKVRRDHTFGNWTSQHPSLRFTKWTATGLRPPGTNGIKTESLPLLNGEVTGGGVSLASRHDLKLGPLADNLAPRLRRSGLSAEPGLYGASLKAADSTAFRFSQSEGAAIVSATPESATKLRAHSVEFANAEVKHAFKVSPGKVEVHSTVGGKPLDALHIARTGNGFSVGLHAADMIQAHRLANLLAVETSPHLLLADPMVTAVIQIGEGASYAVKLRDSARWARLDPEPTPSVILDPGWSMRAAPAGVDGARVVRAKLMSAAELLADAPANSHLVVRLDREGRTYLQMTVAPPPLASLGKVDTGSATFTTAIAPGSKSIHLVSRDALTESSLLLATRLGAAQLATMRQGAHLILPPDPARPLSAALKKGDFQAAAAAIAAAPTNARQEMLKVLAEESQRNVTLLATLGPDTALHHIDDMIRIYGPQPEFLVRKGLLQIERGNLDAAAQIAALKPARSLHDRGKWFEEINAREVPGGVRDNLWRYAQYVDQVNATLGKEAKGFMRSTVGDNRFDFDFVFKRAPAGTPVSSAAGIPEGAKVYWQKNAGLNGVDWSAPLNAAMADIIMGKKGKILHLTEDSIADYRPSAVWLPDTGAGEVKLIAAGGGTGTGVSAGVRCNGDGTDSPCRSGRDSQAPRDVYLVMAN